MRLLTRTAFIAGLLVVGSADAQPPWPAFTATNLNGDTVESSALVGQPTLLIVTPSQGAAGATQQWVEALRPRKS